MKNIIFLLLSLLIANANAGAQNWDSIYHIYTDPRTGEQYMNGVGVNLSCLSYNGTPVQADRLYIDHIMVNATNWTATYTWFLKFPTIIDSETIDYKTLLSGNAMILLNPNDSAYKLKPYVYMYTADSLPLLYGRVKFSFQLTGE